MGLFIIFIFIPRRRLGVVMMRLKMAESVKQAVTLIEQGHIRVRNKLTWMPVIVYSRWVLMSLLILHS